MTKANVMIEDGRVVEGTALLSHATSMALDQDLGPDAVRGLYNLAEDKMAAGRFAEAEELLERGLAVANRRGDRQGERQLVSQGLYVRFMLGRWDEALSNAHALRGGGRDDQWSFQALVLIPWVLVNRGEMANALELLEPLSVDTGWAEPMVMAQCARAGILREMDEPTRALPEARQAALSVIDTSLSHIPVEFAEAVECAFAADELDVVRELLARIDALKPVQLIPLLDAEAMRARGRLAAAEGDLESAQLWFRRSIDLIREHETPFPLARALLQYSEVLGVTDEARALRDEAIGLFEALGATPWLERARAGATESIA
jgi:tetratricopeptide (TPR) repeat protein